MNQNKNMQALKTANNATYKVVDGVTYFKLKSEFAGDYTKNCGLLGEEIDENFYFLRGYDIASIDVDEDRNLIIKRVDEDYEPIIVPIGEELGKDTFAFDKKTGTITVTYPDGTKATMGGFLVEGRDIRIATDSSLMGNGTVYKPLGLSEIERTGTYAPADEYFDITADGEMPEGKGKGYRVVTKEKIDNFGMLYPFEAVQMIQAKLEESGSQWRVPTKEDWDELLNALEPCEEDRNHSGKTVGYFGEDAGKAIKSSGTYESVMGDGDGLWKGVEVPEWEKTLYGEDIVGFNALPLGRCAVRNEMMDDEDHDAEGFGKYASFWADTKDSLNNAYSKTFVYKNRNVRQETLGKGAKMSIRLVKDYEYSNYSAMENILGLSYTTKLIYGPYADVDYVKIWTTQNIYDTTPQLSGVTSSEWSATTDSDRGMKEIYFINEWNGIEWVKKPMTDGDSVVIKNYLDETAYHEWRMIGGELVDTAEAAMEEFAEELNEINEKLDTIEPKLAEAEAAIVALEGRMDTAEADIDAVEGRMDTAEADIDAVEVRMQAAEGDIDAVEGRMDVAEADIDAVEGRMDTAEADIDALEGRMQTAEADIDAVEGRMDTAEADIDALEGRMDTAEADIDAVEVRMQAAEADIDALEGRMDTAEADIESLENRMDTAEQDINNEIANRIANDITPGEYTLQANDTLTVPTNGEDVDDVEIKISDDFFNFGTF